MNHYMMRSRDQFLFLEVPEMVCDYFINCLNQTGLLPSNYTLTVTAGAAGGVLKGFVLIKVFPAMELGKLTDIVVWANEWERKNEILIQT